MGKDNDKELFIAAVKKEFGDSAFKDASTKPKPNHTGSLRLDIALVTPFPEGRIIEIYGNPGAGKTTLALSVLENALKAGKEVQFLDLERKLASGLVSIFPKLKWKFVDEANKDREQMLYAKDGEEAFKLAERFLRAFPRSVLVIDSVDALIPKDLQEKDVGDPTVGGVARLMSSGCRRLKDVCSETGGTVVFLNQIRSKIGGYGNPETTSGGSALGFYATQRIHLKDLVKGQLIQDEKGNAIGQTIRFEVVKNGEAPPFVTGEFPLIYGKGLHKEKELVDIACLIDVLKFDGKYILLDEKKRYPSVVSSMMEADPKFYEETYKKVIAQYPEIWHE